MMIEDVKKLKQGLEVRCPVYDFTIHDRSGETEVVRPAKVLLIDGILILQDKDLCDEMDIKIFASVDLRFFILPYFNRKHSAL